MSNAKNLIEKRRAQKKHQAELARRAKPGYRPIQKKQAAQQPSIKFAPTPPIRTQTTTRGSADILGSLKKVMRHCVHGVSGGFVNFWSAFSIPSFPRTTSRPPQQKVVAASIDPRTGGICGPGILNLDAKFCLRTPFCPDPQAEFFGKRFKSALKSGVALSLGFLKSAKIKSVVLKFGVAAALATVFVAGPFVVKNTAELTAVSQPQPVASKIDLAQATAVRSEAFAKTVEAPTQNPAILKTYATPSTLKDHLSAKIEPNADALFAPKAPASSFVEVIQIPNIPKQLTKLISFESFAKLSTELQQSLVNLSRMGKKAPEKAMILALSNSAYHLLNQGKASPSQADQKAAFIMLSEAGTILGESDSLDGGKAGDWAQKMNGIINGNLSHLHRCGIGTTPDQKKAVFHALLAPENKASQVTLRVVSNKNPNLVGEVSKSRVLQILKM